jgi:RNA polymerase sigma factor (sigma-70 family)
MGMDSDRTLVAATLSGDPAAFARLIVRHRRTVETVLERMLPHDEVEDLLQETFLRAYLGISRLRDANRFGSWLCGIGVNLAKMRLRQRAAQPGIAVGASAIPVDVEERELLRTVQDAVALLPPGQRDVVLMHYVDDLSCEEIARLLDTTAGAVRVRLHRARAQLRRELIPLAPARLVPITKEAVMIEMTVEDVMVRVATDDPSQLVADLRIVLLGERDGGRRLPIWIGAAEGDALAFRLTGDSPNRPITSDLMVELLRATGGRVDRVTVTALREKTFYATVAIAVNSHVEELDARPSDALNLAIRVGAPIFVDSAVLEESAFEGEGLAQKLAGDAEGAELDVPAGEWISLSAELLRELHRPPGK